jgi:hypothetical protein
MGESDYSFAFPGLIHIPVIGMVLYFREKKQRHILVSFFLLSGCYKAGG